jgi:hypothetical protein
MNKPRTTRKPLHAANLKGGWLSYLIHFLPPKSSNQPPKL